MRISDWSSDVCSSDLIADGPVVDIDRNITAEGWFRFDRATDSWMPVFSKGLNNTSPYRMAINSNGAGEQVRLRPQHQVAAAFGQAAVVDQPVADGHVLGDPRIVHREAGQVDRKSVG